MLRLAWFPDIADLSFNQIFIECCKISSAFYITRIQSHMSNNLSKLHTHTHKSEASLLSCVYLRVSKRWPKVAEVRCHPLEAAHCVQPGSFQVWMCVQVCEFEARHCSESEYVPSWWWLSASSMCEWEKKQSMLKTLNDKTCWHKEGNTSSLQRRLTSWIHKQTRRRCIHTPEKTHITHTNVLIAHKYTRLITCAKTLALSS